MKLTSSKPRLAVAFLTALFTAALFPVIPAAAEENIPPGAVASAIVDSVITYYYDTPLSGGMSAMWNDVVSGNTATVKLYADWSSENGILVKDGDGAVFDGAICVPSGHEITIDLNGYSINRGLENAIENGEVICIQEDAVLNLTDTTGRSGKITGGFSTNSAGGIEVAPGGTLNLWGGTITGNRSEASGGGILLEGENEKNGTLYMTGGTISQNSAGVNGGGIAVINGAVEVVSGTIKENQAGGSGGGIYQQDGSVSLQSAQITSNTAVSGAGICTTETASLSLKTTATVQNNVAGTAREQGRGGGILALSSQPIRISGTPAVTANRRSDGVVSNLSLYVNEEGSFVGPRIIDEGLGSGAAIGLNFVGGTARELGFAPAWENSSVFSGDGDFAYFTADGVQYLRRPAQLSDYYLFIWIGCGVLTVLVVTLIVGVIVRNNKRKKRKKHGKKPQKKQAAKQSE